MQTAPIKCWFKCVVVMVTKLVGYLFCFILNAVASVPVPVSLSLTSLCVCLSLAPSLPVSFQLAEKPKKKTPTTSNCLVSLYVFPFLFQLCPHPCYRVRQLADMMVAQDAEGVEDLCHRGLQSVSSRISKENTMFHRLPRVFRDTDINGFM